MAKRYIRLNWQNAPSVATPINATNLNKMDKGINDIDTAVDNLEKSVISEIVNDPSKINNAAVIYSLKQSLDAINNNLGDFSSQLAEKATISNTGDTKGANATDFQFERISDDQVAGARGSFIAGGANNKVQNIAKRGTDARYGYAEGKGSEVYALYGHGEGSGVIVDGKISHAEGNTTICTANDSHAEGNRTVAGRKYFGDGITFGSEDAGDSLGVLQYVLIPTTEGDLTSYFPNKLTDNVATRYGTGSKKDAQGNIYISSHTPAVWNGATLVTANDLTWAMHSVCIVRGSSESEIIFVDIAKATYSAISGTKVYYYGTKPFTTLIGIYSSYSPVLLGGGNGQHAGGLFTSTWGYGANASGSYTRAWGNNGGNTNGYKTKVTGNYGANANGNETEVSGAIGGNANGYKTKVTGSYGSNANGNLAQVTGNYGASANGDSTIASGQSADAKGRETEAAGSSSQSSGYQSKATRAYQDSYAVGQITTKGDNQTSRMSYKHTLAGVGWHAVNIFTEIESGKAYHFETMVIGRQTAGTAEAIGNTFAYKFNGCIIRNSDGTYTVIGTPTRALVGRSVGMSGDGLATGVRISWSSKFTNNVAMLQYDGVTNTTFTVTTYSTVQEMGL